jgi:hypothetical protein
MMSTREARPRRPEPAPDEIERRKRVELERRQAQQAEEQRRTRQISPRPMRRVAPTARRRLFSNLDDVRRAIIVAEVINPPRALRDLEERV